MMEMDKHGRLGYPKPEDGIFRDLVSVIRRKFPKEVLAFIRLLKSESFLLGSLRPPRFSHPPTPSLVGQ